ncbi:MAG: hypothetical protein CSYNP_02795 [Syntrophus sp. SKADARSKE-3]|nr:hypothetical protein [Syntrophus sp. SKADARSKE-3]
MMKSERISKGLKRLLFIALLFLFTLSPCISAVAADTVNYIYDNLNRLTRVEYVNNQQVIYYIIEYSYDKFGNRLTKLSSTASHTTMANVDSSGGSTGQTQ